MLTYRENLHLVRLASSWSYDSVGLFVDKLIMMMRFGRIRFSGRGLSLKLVDVVRLFIEYVSGLFYMAYLDSIFMFH